MSVSATPNGTSQYAKRFAGRAADGHFREAHSLVLSSLGIGTYLGQPDDKTDQSYAASVAAAVESGINVIDAAINYRFQRSERSIGAAIKYLAKQGIRARRICALHQGRLPDARWRDALRPNGIFLSRIHSARNLQPQRPRRRQPLHDAAIPGKSAGAQPAQSWRRVHRRLLPAQSGVATERSVAP